MAGLNGQDGTSCGQIGSAHDVGCGTQVGANTNTPRMEAVATNVSGVSTPKSYVHSATGVAPALVRAAVKKETWVVSSEETSFKLA